MQRKKEDGLCQTEKFKERTTPRKNICPKKKTPVTVHMFGGLQAGLMLAKWKFSDF
ncbi:hypothetical protein DSO57_1026995 [Entomophthora muscae]|uniref:Uncharacterized protein n=1 Tax=Entomophthora muscae TaxID=34485 RepID=A0ACC2TPE4_9FUNG|nr:hypothetical protein DSO57_1026995 [Entomophthora muscae]